MQDWRKLQWHNVDWPLPILQAYYFQKPEAAGETYNDNFQNEACMFSPGTHEDIGTSKNLQRIAINSEYLYHELLQITSVLTEREVIVLGPPYKVLRSHSQ
jgi:hypothetical protein